MKLKQIFISLLLLFVYSLAFAHSIMPHEHGFYAEHQPETHNHEHHIHTDNEIETAHLHHKNHCDEGIVDLILCVLNDFHQHSDDCEDENIIFENSKRLTNSVENDLEIYLASNFSAYSNTINYVTVNSKYFDFESSNICNELSKDNSPLRGPPFHFI
jgi:hypothetical protein